MKRLNDEQRKQVEEHLYLVKYTINRLLFFEIDPQDYDDFYQIGSIGLCKAALTFKEDYGFSFKTYACRCIRNEIGMERRRQVAQRKAAVVISFDQSMTTDDDGLAPCEIVTDKEDIETTLRYQLLKRLLKEAPKREGDITRYMYAGYTQEEVGEVLGISQSFVSRLFRRCKKKLDLKYRFIA